MHGIGPFIFSVHFMPVSETGKPPLLGISTRKYLCDNKTDQVSMWTKKLKKRSNYNNTTVH